MNATIITIIKGSLLIVSCFVLLGCGSLGLPFLPPTVKATPHTLNTIEVTRAFADGKQVYLEYLEAGRLTRVESTFGRIVSVDTTPTLQHFKAVATYRWDKISDETAPLRIVSESYWHGFEEYFFEKILQPKAEFQAVGLSDQAQWYDFHLLQMMTKPLDDSSREIFFAVLQSFLREYNISSERLLFNAGSSLEDSASFVFVDINQQRIEVLNLATNVDFAKPNVLKRSFWTDSGMSLGQLTRSLSADLVLRPLSSTQRLAFLLADTSVDNLKRTSLSVLRFPSLNAEPIPVLQENEGMDLIAWESELNRLTGRSPTYGRINYLIDGLEFFPRFIDSVSTAENELALQFYIFDTDDFATKFADLLREKSKQKDIEVKVIYDGSGSLAASWTDSPTLPIDYHAPASIGQYLSYDSAIKTRALGSPWLAGDHTKAAIIDNKTAFIGGMNIGREYRYDWHDLMMEVRGPVVAEIHREFDKSWAYYGWWGDLGYLAALLKQQQTVKKSADDYPIRLLHTKPNDSEIYNTQLMAIRRAQQYIYIHNSYLTDDVILYELARARRRGVDVRVVMSLEMDAGAVSRSNILSANTLIENGIRVYLYPKLSHVKAAIYDGWACLGSANFDHFSLRVNKELNLATSHPSTVSELKRRLFEKDFKDSVELTHPLETQWTDTFIEIVADHM